MKLTLSLLSFVFIFKSKRLVKKFFSVKFIVVVGGAMKCFVPTWKIGGISLAPAVKGSRMDERNALFHQNFLITEVDALRIGELGQFLLATLYSYFLHLLIA